MNMKQMFSDFQRNILLIVIGVLGIMNACVAPQYPPSNYQVLPTTCESILQNEQISSSEIKEALDQSLSNKSHTICWLPLIKRCLDEHRDIPHQHIIAAIKKLNRYQNRIYFHKAVLRYYQHMMSGMAHYQNKTDRPFMEAYCRYAIKNAFSKNDQRLVEITSICQKLDPWLYKKIFN